MESKYHCSATMTERTIKNLLSGIISGLCFGPLQLLQQSSIDWVAYKEWKFISHNSGGPRSRHLHAGVRVLFPVQSWYLSAVSPHVVGGARELCGVSFKGANTIQEGSILPKASAISIGFQYRNLGDTNIQTVTGSKIS